MAAEDRTGCTYCCSDPSFTLLGDKCFYANRSNANEKTDLEEVKGEYKDCFIFHSFTTGIDVEVVKQVCDEIKNQVANSKSNFRLMAAIERKLRMLAKLACID